MKNFIITAGALLLVLTIMQYQFAINGMLRQKTNLKYVADEAAAAAGLCIDEEAFGNGAVRFDRNMARAKAEASIFSNLRVKDAEELQWEITFSGEDGGQRPSVAVVLRQDRLKAVSEYEYVPYK